LNRIIRLSVVGLLLLATTVAFVACGGKDTREREGMPFMRIRLKNMSPPEGRPARAEATGTNRGAPGPTHIAGPVPPGEEQESQPPGTEASDGVTIRVIFEGGPTFEGSGSYPGSNISTVDIDVAEPEGGEARVNFATGQPSETIPLRP